MSQQSYFQTMQGHPQASLPVPINTYLWTYMEKEMATPSSILAWKISWTEEPGGLQSMGLQRVRHDWAHLPLLLSRFSHVRLCVPPVPGILQARTLEWVAISFSNVWKWKVKVKSLSCVQLFETPWTAAYQAPPPMGFSRQEYWSGAPLPSPNTYYEHTNIRKQVSLAVNSGGPKGTLLLRTPLWGILSSLPPPHHSTEENWHIPNSWHKLMLHRCLLI